MNDHEKMLLLKSKSEMLKAIAHPMRLCILHNLMMHRECNVKTLTQKLARPQSTVSQHLSKLKSIGIIEGHRTGVEIQYRVIDDDVKTIIRLLLKDLQDPVSSDDSSDC